MDQRNTFLNVDSVTSYFRTGEKRKKFDDAGNVKIIAIGQWNLL